MLSVSLPLFVCFFSFLWKIAWDLMKKKSRRIKVHVCMSEYTFLYDIGLGLTELKRTVRP